MGQFETTIIKEDALYFLEQGFIRDDEYQRVLAWLASKSDPEIQRKIADWLKGDSKYLARAGGSTVRIFWYLAPFVIWALWVMRRVLSRKSKELKE